MADMSELAERKWQSSRRQRAAAPAWAVLAAVCAGQFLVVLDVSVVNVALPSIRTGLGLHEAGLQWVINAYALTFAGFLLLGGRAADLFGRKRVFLAGLLLFAVASLAGGIATAPWLLIAARAVQGVGAALLSPTTLTILTAAFPPGPARTRAIGTWSAVGAAGGASGGLIGGLLTNYLSWRWVLLVNVPIGVLVLIAAVLWLPESRGGTVRRLDVPGAVLVTAGMATLAYGIAQTESHGWTTPDSLVPLLGGLAVLAGFLAVQARTREPLMPLGLFRIRSVSSANSVLLVTSAGSFAMWYFLTLSMQNVLHYSPLRAGLCFLPHTLSIILGSKLAPRLMGRWGVRTVGALGGVLMAGGMVWQSRLTPDGTFAGTILAPGIMMALGGGLLLTPVATAATTGADPSDQGLVSGLLNTSRTLGGALGLTVLATVAASHTGSRTAAGDSAEQALASGYSSAFLVASGVVLVGTLMIVLLPAGARRAG
ncbi:MULTISPECIES: MFS transporter [Streptomyces]